MIIGIHQPQYLPWLHYFLKIQNSEKFVILDTADFQKNGLHNRNRIKNAQGSQWLTVPVVRKTGQRIINTRINNSLNWRQKHWNTISQNYNKSSFFKHYSEQLKDIYTENWESLKDLNIALIHLILNWMKIEREIIIASEMSSSGTGSDLILDICLELGATSYLSGIGGKNYLDVSMFKSKGVDIIFEKPVLTSIYNQRYESAGFINDLSVIDLIFNTGKEWDKYVNS